MPRHMRFAAAPVAIFLLVLLGLVHACGGTDGAWAQAAKQKSTGAAVAAKPAPVVHYGTDDLPEPVREMREAILTAVRSGKMEDLRIAVELNEMKPIIAEKPVPDPIAHWRQASVDGEGREILAILGQVLDAGYAVLPIGKDLENNRVYVWPYFAEMKLDTLTPAQDVELLRLVPAATFRDMKQTGRYTHYKLGIGADGTWHFFIR
jgi:hypothetical protein